MKNIIFFFVLGFCIFLCAANPTDDDARQALNLALNQAQISIRNAPFANKTVAILPFRGDGNGIMTGKLKNILTNAGFTCVEGKEDPMWNEIIKELAWDERKDDILDPSTIVKFGKLKAAQILIYGKINVLDQNEERVYAEIELHATDLSTKQHIWGGSFAARYYKGKNVQGIVSIDNNLRLLLKDAFKEAETSIKLPVFAGKLNNVKSVTVIPLAGDIDQYMTGLAIEMLTQTNHSPKNPQIPSLSQMRAFARDGQVGSDAILYGAVRDLHMTKPVEKAEGQKMVSSFTVCTDIQLFLEDVKTNTILWSKTITLQKDFKSERAMNSAEKKQFYQNKFDAVPDEIKWDVIENWQKYATVTAWVIGIILAIIALILGIKAVVSFHNVR